jgi:hypothetical protein
MYAVRLYGGPWDGKEVGVRNPDAPFVRVNGPRHGQHSVWITHLYQWREGRYEFVRTEVVPLSAWRIDLGRTEWLACTDPEGMLASLAGKASDRKLRLFAVACCRRVWHLHSDGRVRGVVQVAERFADGLATAQERQTSEADAHTACRDADSAQRTTEATAVLGDATAGEARLAAAWAAIIAGSAASAARAAISRPGSLTPQTAANAAAHTAEYAAAAAANKIEYAFRAKVSSAEKAEQCRLCRCIFGNPFLPVTFKPAWSTPTVRKLAEAIYEERAFDRLPILADALEEAGCNDAEVLAHCRGPGPHARGCWATDLVLRKE